RVTAPTYAWDHRRYWAVPDPAAAERLSAGLAGGPPPATTAAIAAPAAMAPGEAGAVAAPGEAGQVVAAAGEPLGEPAAGEELGEVGGEIAALWRRMLGVPRVRPGDGFLALGGDSLLALQLTAKLNERFGAGLSLHAVLEARTLAGLAAAVETARRGGGMVSQIPLVGEQIPLVGEQVPLVGERDPLVVELEPGAGDAPLFLLHAVGGSVFGYAPLAAGLRDGQPILGIQPQGFDGAAPLLTTVEEMAERHLQAIRSVQSRGPYYLAGASFGGTLAYAVACRLRAAGERVALLAMIDTPGPGAPLARISSSADVLIEIFGSRLQLDREQLAALDGERQIDWVLARLAAAGQPVPDLDRATAARRIELWRTNYQAMLAYAPPPYPGRAVFFRARQQPAGSAPERAWLELAEAGLETQIVPGDHQTMMAPPHLQVLIERLRKTLTAARFLTSRGDPAASVATKELR
ncbi:MAG TPA: thioesterase domain-containing protein, partial [Thermoanaerobaculia bacterium]|nr:thioesterase domain-containing protein [Thermoanaerobaculia bacterium]